jgi:hypothetical protein
MTIRGGGDPTPKPRLPRRCEEWARRPGALPPMRMTASWFRSARIDRIQGCGADARAPMASSPRILSSSRYGMDSPDQPSLPPCSWPSRASRFAMALRPPLTVTVRGGNRKSKVGTRRWSPAGSNKEMGSRFELDSNCPIQGFRMTADRDDAACTGAVVQTAQGGRVAVPRL